MVDSSFQLPDHALVFFSIPGLHGDPAVPSTHLLMGERDIRFHCEAFADFVSPDEEYFLADSHFITLESHTAWGPLFCNNCFWEASRKAAI